MNAMIEFLNLWGERAVSSAWPMLWQSSLLIALLLALDFALKRRLRAAVRYALWLVVLLKLLLPPSLALPTGLGWWMRSVATIPPRLPTNPVVVTYGPLTAPPLAQRAPHVQPPRKPVMSVSARAFIGWISVVGVLLGWMVWRWQQVAREARKAEPAPDWLASALNDARRSAGLRRHIRLRLVEESMSPALFGLLRPVVLLPRCLA